MSSGIDDDCGWREKGVDLRAVARRTNEIAEANGFDRPSWDNIVVKLALVITELDEAHAALCAIVGDPIEEELADAAIRLLSILDALWPEWSDRITTRQPVKISVHKSAPELLWPCLHYVCEAIERRRHDDQKDTQQCVELALLEVFRLADALDIALLGEIDKKCAKNATRGKLHGKAYRVG